MLTLEKKCNACGVVKNLYEFPKASTCADGHGNKCKECAYKRQNMWKDNNKERYLQHQRNYNKRKSQDQEFLEYIAPGIVALRKSRGEI